MQLSSIFVLFSVSLLVLFFCDGICLIRKFQVLGYMSYLKVWF